MIVIMMNPDDYRGLHGGAFGAGVLLFCSTTGAGVMGLIIGIAWGPRKPTAGPRINTCQLGLTFSLRTLSLVVTVSAVLMGLFRLDVGVGLLYSALLVPPLVITSIASVRRKRCGSSFSASDQAGTFAVAALATMLVGTLLAVIASLLWLAGALSQGIGH
jgi:hypothetical protein